MRRCPKCNRIGVEQDPYTGNERCVWQNCLWINDGSIDLNTHNYGVNFKEFFEAVEKKRQIAI